MKKLNANWFVDGLQDFEYKKYVLLAYLQDVQRSFDRTLLYPVLSEVIARYNELYNFNQTKQEFEAKLPKKMRGVDWTKLKALYASLLEDDEALREIEEIVAYSLPRMKNSVEEGRQIYEFIEDAIEIGPIGLLPLYRDEGYFLLQGGHTTLVKAYEYQITLFENSTERYRGIQTQCIGQFQLSLASSFESIKMDLIKNHRVFPNPATFAICSQLEFPEEEAFVPVAKRKFMRFLATLDARA